MRYYSFWDRLVFCIDEALPVMQIQRCSAVTRPSPAEGLIPHESVLSKEELQLSGSLMRINHVGEICAQALYTGQALSASSKDIQKKLKKAAGEEIDHSQLVRAAYP